MCQGERSNDGIGEARSKGHLDQFLNNMHVVGFQHACIACNAIQAKCDERRKQMGLKLHLTTDSSAERVEDERVEAERVEAPLDIELPAYLKTRPTTTEQMLAIQKAEQAEDGPCTDLRKWQAAKRQLAAICLITFSIAEARRTSSRTL